MAYYFTEPQLGYPNPTSIISVASIGVINGTAFPVGKIVRGNDPNLGGGEFIYLPGVTSCVVGSVVTWNQSANTTTLFTSSTTYSGAPIAVSMAANTSTTALSWYQISGAATVAKIVAGTGGKFNPTVVPYISATAGKVSSAALSGVAIEAARTANTASVLTAATTIVIMLDRPSMEGPKA